MGIGTQYMAPHGSCALKQGQRYWRVGDSQDRQYVVFALFGESKPCVEVVRLSRRDFEQGIRENAVVRLGDQLSLPPWLKALEGQDLSLIDMQPRRLSHGARSHLSVVERRLAVISRALAHFPAILSATSPTRLINQFAAKETPPQNAQRFRTWLLAYICSGQNKWALIENMHRNGRWDRTEEARLAVRRGRPTKYFGHRAWYPCDKSMKAKIKDGYLRFARLGVGLSKVYARSMAGVFQCIAARDEKGYQHWVHPLGDPFPTIGQFRYVCETSYGRQAMQVTLYGAVRYRNHFSPIVGKFSEGVANLLEKVSIDASFSKLVPRGLLGKHQVPRLCTVKLICQASAVIAGIGFSLGGETTAAYKMALFCAAIDKVRWGRIFGMTVSVDDIPGQGLPATCASDRGGFGTKDISEKLSQLKAGRELSPTYNPQSNATVESKNPRALHTRGVPTYVATNMNWVQLARCTINECVEANRSSSAANRLTSAMVGEIPQATPVEVWSFLKRLERDDSKAISFERAVRLFLTPVTFRSREGMLYLKSMRYASDALAASTLPKKIRNSDGVEFPGYVVDIVVRFAWVEYEGYLIEVEAKDPLREDDEALFMPLEELDQHQDEVLRLRAVQRDGRPSAMATTAQRNLEDIGPVSRSDRRLAGRPKMRTAASRADIKQAGGRR